MIIDVATSQELKALEARVQALETPPAKPPVTPPPPPIKQGDFTDTSKWVPTFNDEFDAAEPIPSDRWKTFFYFGDRVLNDNGEHQYYMDKDYTGDGGYTNPQGGKSFGIDPFEFKDGYLRIRADPSDPAKSAHYWGYPYTSGLITTENNFFQLFGRFVARMRMPKGKGLWPAFWLLAKDKTWPPELDPIEFFGGPNANGEGGVTKYHWGAIQGKGDWYDTGIDLTADFHCFAMEWDKDNLIYYFDDKVVSKVPTPVSATNKLMYILINLAVGGNWPGLPDSNTQFPAYLDVDFVRAYRRK